MSSGIITNTAGFYSSGSTQQSKDTMENATEMMFTSRPKPMEFNPETFQLPLNPSRGMIQEKIQVHVSKATNEFYDQILKWIDDFSKTQGKTLDDLSDEGYGLAWEDHGTVNFVQVKDGKVKRIKAFKLAFETYISVPFVGHVG